MAEYLVVIMTGLLCLVATPNSESRVFSYWMQDVAPKFETKQGTAIQERIVMCRVKSQNKIGIKVPVNISTVLNTIVMAGVDNDTLVHVLLLFWCMKPIEVDFVNPRNFVNKNILVSFTVVDKCRVWMQNIGVWAKATYFISISASSFTNLTDTRNFWPNLAEMTCYGVSLKGIPQQWKITMPLLQSLDLTYNKLTEPPKFPWNNSTLEIPHGLRRTYESQARTSHRFKEVDIARNVYIRRLILDYNNIEDLSSHEFRGFLHLLSLKSNGLKTIGPSCFHNLQGIQTIDLSRNKLASLPENLFQGLTSLRNIFLGENEMSVIELKLFQGLERIKKIHLDHNNLHSIPDGLFNSLNTLEVLRLNASNITNIMENPFPPFSALRELYLQNNNLSSIPSWIFRLQEIEIIDLSSNQLTIQDFNKVLEGYDIPIVYGKRRFLNLKNNKITTFGDQEPGPNFNSLTASFEINMAENPLICDCVMWHFVDGFIFRSRQDVKQRLSSWRCGWPHGLENKPLLEIDANQWMRREEPDKCPEECFCLKRCSDGIIFVDCEKKSLKEVPSSMPKGLIRLNLRNNEIKNIPAHPYLINVTVLKLSNNKIKQLQASMMQKLKHIKILLIDSNKLTTLPREIEAINFTTLALDHNVFKCDCTTKWMKSWLLRNKNRIKNFEKVLCNSDHTLGHPMFNLSDDKFICLTPTEKPNSNPIDRNKVATATIVVSVLGGVLFLIAVTVIVLYKYNGEVKVFMFSRFNWHPFDRTDDSDPNKIYDAFISFSDDALQWVVNTLQERLESHNPPYKLCIHHRDFQIGAPIQDNILASVDQSKRMLMVLSRRSVRSEWCLLEFRAAHYKVLKDRTNYLIIILFDDVDVAELDEEMQLYMRTNTYVSISDKWFWQKLFYAMPQHSARESVEKRSIESSERNLEVETMQEIERAATVNASDKILLV